MKKINFAVWNIDGTAMNGKAFTDPKCNGDPAKSKYAESKYMDCIRYRINLLLKHKPDCDFIFFQEIPDPDWLKIPELRGEWISCRKPETQNQVGQTCETMVKQDLSKVSGVLLSQNSTENGIFVKKVQTDYQSPIGVVYAVCNQQRVLFYFIGFWNIPEKKGRTTRTDFKIQKKYLSPFLDLLDRVAPVYTPCVIAGDTNVYVQFGKNERSEEKELLTKEDIQRYLESKKLNLINGPNGELDSFTLRYKCTKNKNVEPNKKLFRCDLLIASSSLRVQSVSLGDDSIYMNRIPGGKYVGSDHLPLFFSYSYDDDSDNKV